MWSGPGAEVIGEDVCQVAAYGTLQDVSVLTYKEIFDEWPSVDSVSVRSVLYDEDTGHMLIRHYVYPRRYLVETWEECTFLESSDWWVE